MLSLSHEELFENLFLERKEAAKKSSALHTSMSIIHVQPNGRWTSEKNEIRKTLHHLILEQWGDGEFPSERTTSRT